MAVSVGARGRSRARGRRGNRIVAGAALACALGLLGCGGSGSGGTTGGGGARPGTIADPLVLTADSASTPEDTP
ncbi:MAG TPA: hypothetical protein VK116_19995, partial [Planctomycetota bacterium]|nr:hypothetical protein [Planctomycetota bacterium]